MAWPFPAHYRPLIRSILFYAERNGWDEDAIRTVLTGPHHRHNAADFAAAYPEARRAEAFAGFLRAAPPEATPGEVWAGCAGECFKMAYGREPRLPAEAWALTRPQAQLGLMYQLTIRDAAGFAWTPTINVPWDAPLGVVAGQIRGWFITGQRSPPPPGAVATQLAAGAKLDLSIIRGALLERIDPTLQLEFRG